MLRLTSVDGGQIWKFRSLFEKQARFIDDLMRSSSDHEERVSIAQLMTSTMAETADALRRSNGVILGLDDGDAKLLGMLTLVHAQCPRARPDMRMMLHTPAGAETVGQGSSTIFSLWIDPSIRRRGAGSALVRRALAVAHGRQSFDTYLHVLAESRDLTAFYGRLGFRTIPDGA